MAKNPELPKKIFIVKEDLELVKDLIGFLTSKLQVIQGKMKMMN